MIIYRLSVRKTNKKKVIQKIYKQDVEDFFNQIDEMHRTPLAVCTVLYVYIYIHIFSILLQGV